MKNYVARRTRDCAYGSYRCGDYCKGQTPGSNGNTPELAEAYVYNTRMKRRYAPHLMTLRQLDDWGVEIVPVAITLAVA